MSGLEHRKRHRAPNTLLRLLEGRALLEAGSSLALLPFWQLAPKGDGDIDKAREEMKRLKRRLR